jgi:hypothetical protein
MNMSRRAAADMIVRAIKRIMLDLEMHLIALEEG